MSKVLKIHTIPKNINTMGAVENQGKITMANASGSSGGPPRKIILLRRNLPPNMKCDAVRELISDDSEGDISLKVISPSLENSLQMSEMQINQQRKRKSFRLEWLDVPEFKDWLSPDPDSPFKARCLACSTILNAGKSELEKHAAGAKHEKAVEALKQMVLEQQEWDEANEMDDEDDVDDMYDTTVNNSTQTELSGEEISAGLKEEQNKHLELLTRIATSMECMAAATTSALESLSKNQETLTNILIHLTNK